MTPSISATSTIASSSASSSAGTSGGESGNSNSGFQVPLTHDSLTFDARQAVRLKEMERKIDEELRKRRSDWKRDVAHMHEEIIQLHPVAVSSDSADGAADGDGGVGKTKEDDAPRKNGGEDNDEQPPLESFVAKRRGSTDVLDVRKMRTLYLEYPDAGRRCKMRFDVAGMDPDRLEVTTDGERIIVRGTRVLQASSDPEGSSDSVNGASTADDNRDALSSESDGSDSSKTSSAVREMHYVRKIEKPKDVDHTKLRSTLTTDGILVVEAPLPPATLNLRSRASSGSPRSATSNNASAAGTGNQHQHNGGGGSSTSASSSASNLARLAAKSSPSRGGSGSGTGSIVASPGALSTCSATGTVVGSSSGQSTVAPGTLQFARELHGIPTFREGSDGRRRMFLVVEIGMVFGPKEVTVQIIKDSRIQVSLRYRTH
jgi:hypothetical protein